MVHTVGIMGVNGRVGASTAKNLVKAAEAGKINLVIFHREGSSAKSFSAGRNVELKVLNFDDPQEKILAAVKGVNVFISAVGFAALPTEPNLVDALAQSPDLVTYIPSTYSTTWSEADMKDPRTSPVLSFIHGGWDRAKERQIGITPIYTGVFDQYWFEYAFVGAPLKANTVWANEKQLKNRVPIVYMDHVGSAISRIATREPSSIKNKEFSVVTFWPTGQELVDLYGKLNGSPATVKPWTAEDRETMMNDAENFGPAKVGYWDRWESDGFRYEKDGRVADKEYQGPSLEEVAKMYL